MTDIDPSYWEPPDDPEAEDRFFDAFADVAREASPKPCPTCDDKPCPCGAAAETGDES